MPGDADRRPGAPTPPRLFGEPGLLEAKLVEEARELGDAVTADDVVHEAADLMFFALAAAVRAGVSLHDIETELDRRALALTRRPGDAKPGT